MPSALCGGRSRLRRVVQWCPVDECNTEMVVAYPDSPWYAPTVNCCKCGDSWSEDGLMERPFARGWRREAVAKHRDMWARATYGPPPTLEELDPSFARAGRGSRDTKENNDD